MEIRQLANGLIKAMLFLAFYMAGVLSSEYLSQFTISSQKDRIETLENREFPAVSYSRRQEAR